MRIARDRVNKTNIVDGSSFAGGQVGYRLFQSFAGTVDHTGWTGQPVGMVDYQCQCVLAFAGYQGEFQRQARAVVHLPVTCHMWCKIIEIPDQRAKTDDSQSSHKLAGSKQIDPPTLMRY